MPGAQKSGRQCKRAWEQCKRGSRLGSATDEAGRAPPVQGAPITGDSFIRVLLNVTALQVGWAGVAACRAQHLSLQSNMQLAGPAACLRTCRQGRGSARCAACLHASTARRQLVPADLTALRTSVPWSGRGVWPAAATPARVQRCRGGGGAAACPHPGAVPLVGPGALRRGQGSTSKGCVAGDWRTGRFIYLQDTIGKCSEEKPPHGATVALFHATHHTPHVTTPRGDCRLDHVADPQALTERLLEVLAVCPEHVRRDAITFLPEVATEDNYDVGAVPGANWDEALLWRSKAGPVLRHWGAAVRSGRPAGTLGAPHTSVLAARCVLLPECCCMVAGCKLLRCARCRLQAVIDALEGMMGEDGACVLPCIEAFANLCLSTEQQARGRAASRSLSDRGPTTAYAAGPAAVPACLPVTCTEFIVLACFLVGCQGMPSSPPPAPVQRRVVEIVLERLQSAEAEDLPAVARFLLQFAAPGACLNSVSKCHGLGPTGTCQLLHCSCRQSIRALLLASHLPCHCVPALQLHSGTTCLLLRPFRRW